MGRSPREPSEKMLQTLEGMSFAPGGSGASQEVEYGWSGGRHVLDTSFSFEHNVFGEALHFALRVDTNRVPAQIRRAYQIIEDEAASLDNAAGKKGVKHAVQRRIEADLRSGRYRRSRLMPVLWDLPRAMVYAAVSPAAQEYLLNLFERTFELRLEPLSAGRLALRRMEAAGNRRSYEDAHPTRFAGGPDGEERAPEYPWVPRGDYPRDWLGNEFLVWLWHHTETEGGVVATGRGELGVVIDELLEMHCAFGETGRDVFRASGPTRMPEAVDALFSGKVPRRIGLIVESGGSQWQLTLSAESFACAGVRLPPAEQAVSPRAVFEQRIDALRDLCETIDALYEAFLKVRFAGEWDAHVAAVRRWIARAARRQEA